MSWPYEQAHEVAMELWRRLVPACEQDRCVAAGSLRRKKNQVGDIEIVYVPKVEVRRDPNDLFARIPVSLAGLAIGELVAAGILECRRNKLGRTMMGAKNKLMRHVATGIPVDLFQTTQECWHNYLVCRTGGKANNVAIAMAAQKMGWKWTPYGMGFERGSEIHRVTSEQDVYEFVGLPYRLPEDRE